VLDLPDEADGQEPGELLTNRLALLFVEATEALLHQLGIGLNVESVLSDPMGAGMLGMSEGFHIKTSTLSRRNSRRAASMSGDMPAHT
jgi:hypothetical protein